MHESHSSKTSPPGSGTAANPKLLRAIGAALGRSFLPLLVLLVLAGSLLWGPWVSLGLALVFWHLAGRLW